MKGIVLSLCDRTGVMVQPWLEAGYPCVIVDSQPARRAISQRTVQLFKQRVQRITANA